MATTSKDDKWAKFIWSNALQKSRLIFAWGFEPQSITTVEDGTLFRIIGCKMEGCVKIQHQSSSNTFRITITPDESMERPIVVNNVLLENVVSTINDSLEYHYLHHNQDYMDLALAS